MARPLRIDVAGGWYHVMSRGIERRAIFLDNSYCFHFLDLLGEMTSRFNVEVHAYVLMGNHYHLILRTPEANASQTMQWLNVSYSAWFNAKRQRVGHLFQGRFCSTLIDGGGGWLLDMSAYLHLNPVRVSALGLMKADNKAEALGLVKPNREQVLARLRTLRDHRWSSYRAYGNYGKTPPWLFTEEVLRRAGGKAAYRKYVQQYVTRGMDPSEFVGRTGRVAVGGRDFLDKARSLVGSTSPEQPERRFVTRHISFATVVAAVENVKGEQWEEFRNRYGDWGLSMVLYLARLRTGLSLKEIGSLAGEMEYKNVSTRVRRFKKRLAEDRHLRESLKRCLERMTNDET
jgi:putative transposase